MTGSEIGTGPADRANAAHMPREGMLSLGSMTLKTDSWVLTYGP